MRRTPLVALCLALAGCPSTPTNKAAIHVTVEVRAPIDCLRVVVSDENKGPVRFHELELQGSAETSQTFNFAVLRDPAWGLNARVFPEGRKGGCSGAVVVR